MNVYARPSDRPLLSEEPAAGLYFELLRYATLPHSVFTQLYGSGWACRGVLRSSAAGLARLTGLREIDRGSGLCRGPGGGALVAVAVRAILGTFGQRSCRADRAR